MENQLSIALNHNKLLKNVDISKIDLQNIKGKLLTIGEGEILYREGDTADIIFLVISGEINILKKRLLGKTKSYLFMENDFFGHEEFFEETSRTSTAVALRDSYLISLTRDEVESLVRQDNEIHVNLREPVPENFDEAMARKEELKPADTQTFDEPELISDRSKEAPSTSHKEPETEKKNDYNFSQFKSDSARTENKNLVQPVTEIHNEKSFRFDDGSMPERFPIGDSFVSKEEGGGTRPETCVKDKINELPFDENAYLDEDGIPKPEFEIPEIQSKPAEAPEENNKTDNDLDDALFQILTGGEALAFQPPASAGKNIPHVIEPSALYVEPEPVKDLQPDKEIPVEIGSEETEPLLLSDFPDIEKEHTVRPEENDQENPFLDLLSDEPRHLQEEAPAAKPPLSERPLPLNEPIRVDVSNEILNVIELINSNITSDSVLKNIIQSSVDSAFAERAALYRVDWDKNELSLLNAGPYPKEKVRFGIGTGIAGTVAAKGEPINLKDVKDDPIFLPQLESWPGYIAVTVLSSPVRNRKGEIIAVLQLLNCTKGEFGEREESFMERISIHYANAIENSFRVETLQRELKSDSLKKMANFLANEVKKPVLVGRRYAEHLLKKQLPADATQLVNMIIDQLGQAVDSVNINSKCLSGDLILRTMSLSLNGILSGYAVKAEQYAENRLCQIVNKPGDDCIVKLDAKEFFQCYLNIIRNACDAMPDGGNITVSTRRAGNKIEIQFKDNGQGIPEGLEEKIFEPFVSYNRKEGAGLGLTVAKKLVELHNGSIRAESTYGEGSKIIISIPVDSAL